MTLRMLAVCLFPLLAAICAPAGGYEKERLEEILSRPAYQRWRGGRLRDDEAGIWSRMRDRIREWLSRRREREERKEEEVSPRRNRAREASSWGVPGVELVNAAAWALFLGGAGFLLYIFFRAWLDRTRPRKRAAGPKVAVAEALASGDALAYDRDAWRGEAEKLERAGDFRHAFRALYLGLLSGLHECGLIAFSSSRTNWHYVRTFRGDSGGERFAELTGVFDRVWYGREAPVDSGPDNAGRADLAQFRREADALLAGGRGNA